jgi:hypothetical protein
MSNFNLDEFKNEALSRDMARPNLFEVVVSPPTGFLQSGSRLVSLFCDSASLPSQNLVTKRTIIYGQSYPRVTGADYGDRVSLTFFLDADMLVKRFFEDWLDLAVNRSTQNISYQNAYIGGLDVIQLKSKDHDESYRTVFEEVFPVGVQLISVDNNQSNSIHRLEVYFEYRRWFSILPNAATQKDSSSIASQTYAEDANSVAINTAMGFSVVDEFNGTI